MRELRALVVDDSSLNRRTIAAMLDEIDGVSNVDVAKDGAEALRLVEASPPDFITLDLEKQRSAHELKVDEPLPEGDLYVEISGPESWPVPATFEDNKTQVAVNGRVVIQWNEIPNAEITVKFVDYAGQLKLDVEALYRESSRLRYALTPDEMENLKKTLPKNLQEAKARFAFLDRVGPQMNAKLGQLQSELAREMSRPLAERDGRKISILNTQIRNLQSDMKKGRNEYIRLQKEIPRLQKLTLQVLPRLDNLVSALHNSAKLHYRIFSKTSEDE